MSHVADGALHAYLDGACDERERREIESHLEACESCRARRDEAATVARRASELLSELEPIAPQAPAWREIEARAAARARSAPRRRRLQPLAWAASIVIAFGLGWMSQDLMFMARSPIGSAPAYSPASEPSETEREARYWGRATGQRVEEEASADAVGAVRAPMEKSLADEVGEATTDAAVAARQPATIQPQETAEAQAGDPAEGAEAKERAPDPAAVARARTEDQARDQVAGATPELERRAAAPERTAAPERKAAEEPPPAAPRPSQAEAIRNRVQPQMENLSRGKPEAPAEVAASAIEVQAFRAMEADDASVAEFLPVQPAEAAVWLGAPLVTLPELDLQRVEVGPGALVYGANAGLPVVRTIYLDAAGHEIALMQQHVRIDSGDRGDLPSLRIDPDGSTSYRWRRDGYWLALQAELSSDALRSLADRVR